MSADDILRELYDTGFPIFYDRDSVEFCHWCNARTDKDRPDWTEPHKDDCLWMKITRYFENETS